MALGQWTTETIRLPGTGKNFPADAGPVGVLLESGASCDVRFRNIGGAFETFETITDRSEKVYVANMPEAEFVVSGGRMKLTWK